MKVRKRRKDVNPTKCNVTQTTGKRVKYEEKPKTDIAPISCTANSQTPSAAMSPVFPPQVKQKEKNPDTKSKTKFNKVASACTIVQRHVNKEVKSN